MRRISRFEVRVYLLDIFYLFSELFFLFLYNKKLDEAVRITEYAIIRPNVGGTRIPLGHHTQTVHPNSGTLQTPTEDTQSPVVGCHSVFTSEIGDGSRKDVS